MANSKITKVKALRASDESFESIQRMEKENGISQGELIEDLIRAYQTLNAKKEVPGSADVIDDFKHHLDRVYETFLYAVELSRSADERAKEATAKELISLEAIIKTMQEEKSKAAYVASEASKMIVELQEANTSLNDQITDLKGSLVELRASVCDKQLIIETLTSKLPEQEKTEQRISDMRKVIDSLQDEKTVLTHKEYDARSALDNLKRKHDLEKSQHNNEIITAVLNVKVEAQKQIEDVVLAYQTRIDDYVAKNEEKDAIIESLRNELYTIIYKSK